MVGSPSAGRAERPARAAPSREGLAELGAFAGDELQVVIDVPHVTSQK